jgi:hypothetical protein
MAKMKFSAGVRPKGDKVSPASVIKKKVVNKVAGMKGKHGVGGGMLSGVVGSIKNRQAELNKAAKN